MNWKEIKAKSKDIVHETFSYPAIFISPDGVETNCNVRWHSRLELFGDLDREGFSKRFEEIHQAVFDSQQVVPKKKGVVDFGVNDLYEKQPGVDAKFIIVNITPAAGDRYIRTEVTQL